jgi:hypothetical protein
LLCSMARTLPDKVQEMVLPIWGREGVNHISGRWPSAWSIGVWLNNLESQGAWPWGLMHAMTSDVVLGRSVGVETAESPWCGQSRVNSAN